MVDFRKPLPRISYPKVPNLGFSLVQCSLSFVGNSMATFSSMFIALQNVTVRGIYVSLAPTRICDDFVMKDTAGLSRQVESLVMTVRPGSHFIQRQLLKHLSDKESTGCFRPMSSGVCTISRRICPKRSVNR